MHLDCAAQLTYGYDKVLDFIMAQFFPQILHNGTDLGNQLATCREPYPTLVLFIGKGGGEEEEEER